MNKESKSRYQLRCDHTNEILFEGWFKSIKNCVEKAVSEGVCLDGVNLSGQNLACANLDDAQMTGANLSGVNFNGANLSEGVFDYANFTDADLSNACLVLSSFMNVNFHGCSFGGGTDVTDAVISACQFSCPSVFSTLLHRTALFINCYYHHENKDHYEMMKPPVIIQGLSRDIVFLDDAVKIGNNIVNKEDILLAGHKQLKFLYGNEVASFLLPVFEEISVKV